MSDPHGPYGAPPGPPQYGAPPPYGSPQYGGPYVQSEAGYGSELSELDDSATTWLIVGLAGFWFGFGWITGPLAWYFGSQARGKYRALGREPSSRATGAWVTGIVTTIVSYIAIAVVTFLIVFYIGAFLALF